MGEEAFYSRHDIGAARAQLQSVHGVLATQDEVLGISGHCELEEAGVAVRTCAARYVCKDEMRKEYCVSAEKQMKIMTILNIQRRKGCGNIRAPEHQEDGVEEQRCKWPTPTTGVYSKASTGRAGYAFLFGSPTIGFQAGPLLPPWWRAWNR